MFQVNIQQEDLERFLIVAGKLQVHGLSGKETESDELNNSSNRKRNLADNKAFNPAKAARKECQIKGEGGGGLEGLNSDHVITSHNLHPQTGDLDIKTEVLEERNLDFRTLEQNYVYEEFYDEEVDISPGRSSKSVKCPYCEKVLKYRHNLKGHIQTQHGAGEPEAPCPICPDKIFKNSASLRDHMSRKHRGEKAAAGAQQQQQQQQQLQPHLI